ncbi:FUN14 domain-containing protein, partial [Thermococcus sp.]
LSLFYLQQKGVITINTDKLFNLTNNIAQQVVSAGQKVLGILPGTSAFVAGFYLGFKKG